MKIVCVEGDLRLDPAYAQKMDKYLSSLDMKDSRYNILSYPQVKRLSNLMNETIPIQGRGNFPTLEVKLVGLVVLVKSKLEAAGIPVHDVRLNGSVASSVLAVESNIEYNDLDLIFSIDLDTHKQYEKVKHVVLDCLLDLLPEGTNKERMSSITLKEAYVSKMVKVTDTDRWSLIGLGNNQTKCVELKFVDMMKRKYEFSVDSFHIILDTLFLFYECSKMCMSENFYPTVVGESVYGDFPEALFHLENRLIATKHPEQIRGGGLLKYCNLLVKNYRPAVPEQVKHMERYMCSRFFIDFSDLTQQRNKLLKFLDNHFLGPDCQLKYDYLTILYQVVDESTVCLMGHERRQTLALIEALSCNVFLPYDSTISNSNWCNGGGGGGVGDLSSQSSYAYSSHSSRSSPGPGSYSSPGSSSSYPSPAPSSTNLAVSSYATSSPSPPSNQSYSTTPTHSVTPPHHNQQQYNNGGQYSPMSAASSSPQSLSPKPSAGMNGGGAMTPTTEEYRMVPISWVTLSSAPPPPVAATLTSDSSLTTNQTVTYRQIPLRSIPTVLHPCTGTLDNASSSCSQQPMAVTIATTCSMVGPPPSQPPPPVTATIIQASPPPNQGVVSNGGHLPPQQVATYEIITTGPPQMLYSNGNYYTAFLKTAPILGNGAGETTVTAQPCYTCSCTCQAASIQWTMPPNQTT
jgi:hypothetical protein